MGDFEMQPSSPKRPRLSIFHQTTGAELDAARQNNDMALKNRFEAIFAKYTRDFTGIGDEIDLMTGEVVVNNGHLESMEAETDLGLDNVAGGFSSVGRSMLRAMTVTLNPDLPGPDDVLMSIESIAENAALADDDSSEQSSDDLFDTSQNASLNRSESFSNNSDFGLPNANMEPYNSDSDSLFEQDAGRSGSPDSLFGDEDVDDEGKVDPYDPPRSPTDFSHEFETENVTGSEKVMSFNDLNDDDQVIARFGPYVGKEILHMIDQRRHADVEPAWRIPVRLEKVGTNQSSSRVASASPMQESPESKRNQSLWTIPRPSKKRKIQNETSVRQLRDESADPLQDDSSAESEVLSQTRLHTEMTDSDDDFVVEEGDEEQDRSIKMLLEDISITGNCPYCESNFKDKQGVMTHWDRFLKRPPSRIKKNDPHNIMVMKEVRASAPIRRGLLRLVVYDFRSLIELHEGAGMTFEEIACSKTLRTRKTGLQLQEIYNKYRTPPNWKDTDKPTKRWTDEEEAVMHRLSNNPLTTMTSFERSLKGRSETEIGNRLAENWLKQLAKTRGEHTTVSRSTHRFTEGAHSDMAASVDGLSEFAGAGIGRSDIKQEESEDELFLGI